jgi:hypothetical protein
MSSITRKLFLTAVLLVGLAGMALAYGPDDDSGGLPDNAPLTIWGVLAVAAFFGWIAWSEHKAGERKRINDLNERVDHLENRQGPR